LEVLHAPSFSKNLLSATQLSTVYGYKQVIDPWTSKLTITKDDEVVATGTYDKDEKLIKIVSDIFYSIDDNQLMDELWIDDTINSSDSETAEELDSEDDAFFDADLSYDEEEISDEESSNMISYLLTDKWWMTPEYNDYDLFHAYRAVTDGIPTNFAEAMKSEDRDHWKAAMDCEMKNIRDNDTYQIKKIKNGEKAIGCRWVFKKKLNKDGSVNKFKARLVAKGYLQRFGTDYNETFAPVAKLKSIRLLLAISAHQSWKVYHDDVASAFLNGILKEKVIMDQPDGYQQGSSLHKWELQKTLYNLSMKDLFRANLTRVFTTRKQIVMKLFLESMLMMFILLVSVMKKSKNLELLSKENSNVLKVVYLIGV
jgi:hypothetical protein